jgi:hypothetical protein
MKNSISLGIPAEAPVLMSAVTEVRSLWKMCCRLVEMFNCYMMDGYAF